jgi:hypothetical protein
MVEDESEVKTAAFDWLSGSEYCLVSKQGSRQAGIRVGEGLAFADACHFSRSMPREQVMSKQMCQASNSGWCVPQW